MDLESNELDLRDDKRPEESRIGVTTVNDTEMPIKNEHVVQINQNSSLTTCVPTSSDLDYLHQNYMFQSVFFKTQISKNYRVFKEIFHRKPISKPVKNALKNKRTMSSENLKQKDKEPFDYYLEDVQRFREKYNLTTQCEWLDFRLNVHEIVNDDCVSLEDILVQLRSGFLYTVIDLMIFYHTNSDFALQLSQTEGLNLLIVLKHSLLDLITKELPDEFSETLIKLIKTVQSSEEKKKELSVSIPSLAERLMINYIQLDPFKSTMKCSVRNVPKIVYYSLFVPSFIVIDGANMNKVLERKIQSLQRKYNCKIVVNGPYLRNLSPGSKNEYFHIAIFFDYFVNYWNIVLREFVRWVNGFPRCSVESHIDLICVSYLSERFFCCDEIRNLMKRQHMLREVDRDFVDLIKWVKMHQIDRSFF